MSIRLVIFFLLINQLSFAQIIQRIEVEGLKRTKRVYVDQFLRIHQGDSINILKLKESKTILSNLEVFSTASFEIDSLSNGNFNIIFHCSELYTLLPILNFGSLTNNSWFQVGISEANLFGKGHKVYAYYQYYDRNSLAFHLNLNRVNQSPWGIDLNFIKWSTLEPLFFDAGTVSYAYDNYTYGVNLKYSSNLRHNFLIGASYFTEEYRANSPLVEGAPLYAFKRKVLTKFRFDLNYINYYYFYQEGVQNVSNIQTVSAFNKDPFFLIWYNDLTYFYRLGKRGNFASRLRIGISSNQDSPFAPFVLDSYLNIRGVGNRVDRGTGTMVANFEYRHALIDKNKIAFQLNAFLDAGSWRQPGGNFNDFTKYNNQVYFAGLGSRIILKDFYQAILRVDYGFDLKSNNQGIVIGLGQYF